MKLAPFFIPFIAVGISAHAAIPETVETGIQQYISLAQALTPVLEKIQDQQSADASAEELRQLLPRVYETRTALQKIETLTPILREELTAKYGKTMQEEWGKVYTHIFRLQQANCYNSVAFYQQFRTLCMMLL